MSWNHGELVSLGVWPERCASCRKNWTDSGAKQLGVALLRRKKAQSNNYVKHLDSRRFGCANAPELGGFVKAIEILDIFKPRLSKGSAQTRYKVFNDLMVLYVLAWRKTRQKFKHSIRTCSVRRDYLIWMCCSSMFRRV